MLQYKGTFLNNKPVGKFIYNFESGQKKAELVHGLPGGNSSVLLFFENGQLLSDGFYKGEKKILFGTTTRQQVSSSVLKTTN